MADGRNKAALVVSPKTTTLRNKISQVTAIQQAKAGTVDYVAHVTSGDGEKMPIKTQGLSYDQ